MKNLKSHRSFGGVTQFFEHDSEVTRTKMKFSIFRPEGPVRGCLIWLSGLTCTEENFIAKAGAQKYLAQEQLMVLCPDTSPRGLQLPHEHESDDFGSGAGFYIDATTAGYRDHYRMEIYVTDELLKLARAQWDLGERFSLSGHSMGGHGALTLGLRHPGLFHSISAFSPIVHPTQVPWGQKAFAGYFGENQDQWARHDACELIGAGKSHPREILIDQGTQDPFLEKQLRTQDFEKSLLNSSQKAQIRMQEGYDHSYYFIASFIEDHIKFHASPLK